LNHFHSLKKLLGHQILNTTPIYARVIDETLYKQCQEAMALLEATSVQLAQGMHTVHTMQKRQYIPVLLVMPNMTNVTSGADKCHYCRFARAIKIPVYVQFFTIKGI